MNKNDITVILTSGCTMNCKYCFEHERDHSKDDTMSFETLVNIFEKYQSLGENFNFHLFGGEPTLNKDALLKFTSYLESQKVFKSNFFIDIQTNLYNIDEDIYDIFRRLSVIAPCGFGVCVSIDGVSSIGNSNRIDHDGVNTFDVVRNNLAHLREKVPSAYIDTHSVISDANANEFTLLVQTLKSWCDDKIIDNFGMNWIDPDTTNMSITNESINSVVDQYWSNIQPTLIKDKYTEEMQSGFMIMGLDFYLPNIEEDPEKLFNVCGAGTKTTAYLPNGEEIPCHKYMDKRAQSLNRDIFDYKPNINDVVGEDSFKCIDCPLVFNCHTCIASNELYGGNINQKSIQHCKRWRYIMKTSLRYKLKYVQKLQLLALDDQRSLTQSLLETTKRIATKITK